MSWIRKKAPISNVGLCQHVKEALSQQNDMKLDKKNSKCSCCYATNYPTDINSDDDKGGIKLVSCEDENNFNKRLFTTDLSVNKIRVRSCSFEHGSLIKRKRKKSLLLQDLKEEEIEELYKNDINPTKESKKN